MPYPIEVESLEADFKVGGERVHALKGISFHVEEGSAVGFLGPNGAGKTTSMHILLGFVDFTGGAARLFGEDVRRQSARSRIGYLPEHPQSYPFLRGIELLRMSGRIFGIKGKELRRRVDQVLDRVGMQTAARRFIGTYSRGMMQRIGVAQALINDPDLLILDEPTGGLDPVGRLAMRDIIAELKQEGKTVFFSSHELSEVERVCDRVIMLRAGEKVAEGSIDELVGPGESLEQYFIEQVCASGGRAVQ